VRIDDLTRVDESSLLGVMLQRQGLTTVSLSEGARAEMRAAARKAAAGLDERIIPKALVERVQTMLEEYRALHKGGK
jgi:hypothetical protein